jgi:hypothetical protein
VGGIFPESTSHRQPLLNTRTGSRRRAHMAGGRARRAPSAPAPMVGRPASSFVWWATFWACDSVLIWASPILVLDLGFFILLLVCAFPSRAFSLCFTCFLCMFPQYINSTGTSGNMLVVKVYVCRSVQFSPFWTYVGYINVSVMTANTGLTTRLEVSL